ncbi:MAG: thioredoxin domain-containing protein, partial [Ignavibacteria bacterium]
PKFPRPSGFNFLLRFYNRSGDKEALNMVSKTLLFMSKGGIYDHLGGGFHRYSVDRYWRVPHFEKMLYDQAQLAITYTEAFQITNDKFFAGVAADILSYVSKKLTDKGGGFYSAEDAESAVDPSKPRDKEEGAFYVWEKAEIEKLFGQKNSDIFCFYYGIGERGNAPAGSDPHNVLINKNILYVDRSLSETANKFNKSTDEIYKIITESKKILLENREKRPLPHLDDKILVSWNGLMISAFLKAYQVFNDSTYLNSARRSADFILANLYDPITNTLLHRFRDGEAKFEGTLDDYAFFTQGLLDLYESSFEDKYLDLAVRLTGSMIQIFYDNENGGFFDVSGKDKSILIRTKEEYDSAEPTGNSIAIMNLLRVSHFTDNQELFDKAYKSLLYFSAKMSQQPYAMPQMLCALDYFLHNPKQIIISGDRTSSLTKEMIREVHKRFLPGKILIFANGSTENKLIPFLSNIVSKSDKTTAYVCENYTCKLPARDISEFKKQLDDK